MVLEIYKKKYEVLRSYYPAEGEFGLELPVLLHGTLMAFKTTGWPQVWYVGWLKVNPNNLALHFVSTEDIDYRLKDPIFYRELWVLNKMVGFGTYLELHVLKQDKEVVL